ncbi:MAG: diaminopimelate decarboxylase [Alphaproteobacteria bacterium]|nr:diaminopimelate decarboxylase [Alphaproteobacteria bacterium]
MVRSASAVREVPRQNEPTSGLPGLDRAFAYRGGVLTVEDVDLTAVAAAVGTPAYVYSEAALVGRYRLLADALAPLGAMVCYALKANSNQAVIATFARSGAGADVVSEGEMRRALAAGVPADRVVFAGVGKTRDELRAALAAGIMQVNVESEPELELLDAVAREMGRTAAVALRVNPDVDARTHAKISTGRKENKFGIDIALASAAAARAHALPGIAFKGFACHIGSQLTELAPFREAFARVAELVRTVRAQGIPVEHLDLGGGLGVRYGNEPLADVAGYAQAIRDTVAGLGCRLVVEPGRFLVAEAGLLLARVVYVKQGESRRFVIVDAAMNDLVRPAMYDAFHAVLPVREPPQGTTMAPVDLVGPICESSDTFARDRPMQEVSPGELVVFCTAGAYGAAMSSTYNSRPLVPEVLVRGDRFAVVRPRQAIETLLALDRLPPWHDEAQKPPGAANAARAQSS